MCGYPVGLPVDELWITIDKYDFCDIVYRKEPKRRRIIMAKIKFGAIVTDARGKLDGIVFSKNQFGAYTRTKVTPVNPNSTRQTEVRNNLALNSKAWSNVLADAQRSGWKALAENNPVTDIFGNSQVLTGIALYGRVNNVLRNLLVTPLDTAPPNLDVTGLISMVATAGAGLSALDIAFADTPLPANHKLYIFATGNLPGGVSFFKPRLRFIGASVGVDVSPFDAGALWEAKFGELIEGNKLGIAVATVNEATGAVSTAIQSLITIGA